MQNKRQQLVEQAKIVLIILAIMWGLEIFDWITNGFLDSYGIRPRTSVGLRGVLFAPFLHFGFGHLIANSVPFLVLGFFVMLRGTRNFAIVTLTTVIIGGLGTWLIGNPGNHLGASILIFGYFGYLLFSGLFERSPQALGLMLVVILLYGSLIWGVFPIWARGISWEGHLSGFIAGGLAARWLTPVAIPVDDLSDQIEIL